MKDKRGFLLGEETVKLILAVIAIVFLIVFVVYLYSNLSQNKELEQAKSSLTYLSSQISSGSSEAQLYNPQNWILSSYSSSSSPVVPGAAVMPKQCSSKGWSSCLCLCAAPGGSVKSFLLACDTNGICTQNDFSVKDGSLNLGSNFPVTLSIDKQNKLIQLKA